MNMTLKKFQIQQKEVYMEDKKAKAYYEDIFLYFFDHISCPEKQKKAWVHGDYNACNTFGEVCNEFMSSCKNVKKWQHFSAEQKEKLCKVYDLLKNYNDMKEVEGKRLTKPIKKSTKIQRGKK